MKKFSQEQAGMILQKMQAMIEHHKANLQQISDYAKNPLSGQQITQLVEQSCVVGRQFNAEVHSLKMFHDWGVHPQPEWMDHFIDQHFQTRHGRATLWMERGVYGILALKRGGRFLELCCGDGYNTFHFYSPFAESVIAVDFDDSALAHARKHNTADNISFAKADIRTGMPDGRFDNILWDAAIEHFTEDEIAAIMNGIKARLSDGGILSGYTLIEKEDGKHLDQHEREFRSKQDLADFLTPHFKNVAVFETIHPQRHNLYFYASDGVVPFDSDWPHILRIKR